jgi:hypothetical protein
VTFTVASVPSGYTVGQLIGATGFSTTAGQLISGLPFTITATTGTSITATSTYFVHANVTTTTDSATAALAWNGPAFGSSQLDTTWGTTAYRAPLPTDCPVTSSNSTGNCATNVRGWVNDYSKTVPWSQDGHYYIMLDTSGWLYEYDASSGPPYTFVRRINSATLTTNPDQSAGGGLYNDGSNWNWSNIAGTHIMYYTGTPATGKKTQLKSIDFSNYAAGATIVRDFATEVAALGGDTIDEDREGNQSDDDNIWSWDVRLGGTGGTFKGVIRWNKTTNAIVSKGIGAGGICGASACPGPPNWVGTSPSGNYTIINWDPNCPGGHNYQWARGCGTEVFDSSLTFLGPVDANDGHADVGYDVNGVEVYVTVPDNPVRNDYYAVSIVNLAQVQTTIPTCTTGAGCSNGFLPPAGSRTVNFPCGYDWSGPTVGCPTGGSNVDRNKDYTISMRSTQGAARGYMLWSEMDDAQDNLGGGGWGGAENLAVLIDWATAYQFPNDGTDGVPAVVYRLGRTHAENALDPGYYEAQANGVPDKTFSKFSYTSNFDINGVDHTSTTAAMFTLLPTGTGTPTFVPMQGALIQGRTN